MATARRRFFLTQPAAGELRLNFYLPNSAPGINVCAVGRPVAPASATFRIKDV
jgi:hypothetical protein